MGEIFFKIEMVLEYCNEYYFENPFHQVCFAFWKKYPNLKAPHVITSDVYERKICEVEGDPCLVTNRLITCHHASIPDWLVTMGVSKTGFVIESSVVNPRTRELIIRSHNITGSSLLSIKELCQYTGNTQNTTFYQQKVEIKANIPFFSEKLEAYIGQTLAVKSQQGIEMIKALLFVK